MTSYAWQSLLPRTVGFDNLISALGEFDSLGKPSQTYPPYNIVKVDSSNYLIEIAVAGFSRDELEITLKNHKLTITSSALKSKKEPIVYEYIHRGIGKRDFAHVFTLADTVEIIQADIVDGLLKIELRNVIPKEMEPKTIEIGKPSSSGRGNKQLLNEGSAYG